MTPQQQLKRGKSTDGLGAVSDAPPNKLPKTTEDVVTPSATADPEEVKKQLLLNMAPQRAQIPSPPNFDESVMGINGNAMNAQARRYFEEVALCAQYYVTEWVMKPKSEGGLNILKPLCEIQPLKISNNETPSGQGLTTFCETWDAKIVPYHYVVQRYTRPLARSGGPAAKLTKSKLHLEKKLYSKQCTRISNQVALFGQLLLTIRRIRNQTRGVLSSQGFY